MISLGEVLLFCLASCSNACHSSVSADTHKGAQLLDANALRDMTSWAKLVQRVALTHGP